MTTKETYFTQTKTMLKMLCDSFSSYKLGEGTVCLLSKFAHYNDSYDDQNYDDARYDAYEVKNYDDHTDYTRYDDANYDDENDKYYD